MSISCESMHQAHIRAKIIFAGEEINRIIDFTGEKDTTILQPYAQIGSYEQW